MGRFCLTLSEALLALTITAFADGVAAQSPALSDSQTALQTILDRIHAHAASDDWRKERLKDEQIEVWLDQLTTPIIQAAELAGLKIPVRFADVRPAGLAPQIEGSLLIGKDMDLETVRRSIVLADGDVHVGRIEDSVIIARGCVLIGPGQDWKTAERSVIISGIYVYFDVAGNGVAGKDGCIIASRGWADGVFLFGTAIIAPEGVTGSASRSVYINLPVPKSNAESNNRSVSVPNLPLGKVGLHPMSSKIGVVGIVSGGRTDGGNHIGLAFQYDGRRYVAMIDKPIVDESGNPVVALIGWRLKHVVADFIAIFETEGGPAAVRIRASAPVRAAR